MINIENIVISLLFRKYSSFTVKQIENLCKQIYKFMNEKININLIIIIIIEKVTNILYWNMNSTLICITICNFKLLI